MHVVPARILHLGKHLIEGADGNEHQVVVAAPQEGALLLEDSYHLEGHAVEHEFLPDGILPGPQGLHHIGGHHTGSRGVEHIGLDEEPTILHHGVVGRGIVGVRAAEGGPIGLIPFPVLDAGFAIEIALLGDRRRQGGQTLQRLGILAGEILAPFLFLGNPPAPETRLVFLELHQVGTEGRKGTSDRLVEARHEAHHGDDRGHPGGDAEER